MATDPFEGMTPAEAYRAGYLAGRVLAAEESWKDLVANVEQDTRRLLDRVLWHPQGRPTG